MPKCSQISELLPDGTRKDKQFLFMKYSAEVALDAVLAKSELKLSFAGRSVLVSDHLLAPAINFSFSSVEIIFRHLLIL